jgi:hypothetical protein
VGAVAADTYLKKAGCLAILACKAAGNMRCFGVVGCTSGLRFDAGVVYPKEKEGFRRDGLKARPWAGPRRAVWGWLRAGWGPRPISVLLYTIFLAVSMGKVGHWRNARMTKLE